MDVVLFVARLVLAAVFAIAGVAKLVDLEGSQRAIRDFAVPSVISRPIGLLLPLAELVVAAALIPRASAWWAAAGAAILLAAFVAGIGFNMSRGRAPDCHCFGQLHSAPAGWPTIMRNSVLLVVAGLILLWGRDDSGLSVTALVSGAVTQDRVLAGITVVEAIVIVAVGWVVWSMRRDMTRLSNRVGELENAQDITQDYGSLAGSDNGHSGSHSRSVRAPTFRLPDVKGEIVTMEALRAHNRPVLIVFTDPGCGVCIAMLPEIGRWQHDYSHILTLAIVSRGTPERIQDKVAEHGLRNVLVDASRDVGKSYSVVMTPAAVLVNPDGTLGSAQATGPQDIRMLMANKVEGFDPSPPVLESLHSNGHVATGDEESEPLFTQIGDDAPLVSLQDLQGNEVTLGGFIGEQMLLLFWSPQCRFSMRMLPDLLAWEQERPPDAPKLLIVSSGSREANQDSGLTSTIVLDNDFALGHAVGARGTPSAVLVDADGRVASEVVMGPKTILALAGTRTQQDDVLSA